VDLPSGFPASLLQGSQEKPAIGVIAENGLFVIPAIHDVINCRQDIERAPFEPSGRDKQRKVFMSIRKR
jgi:hypothetical protein